MKSVLISIQPKWCELIASGKKTIEVRKTAPKLETPFKCYIYQTKAKPYFDKQLGYVCENLCFINGIPLYHQKVIGEFVCDKVIQVKNDSKYSTVFGGFDIRWNIDTEKTGLTDEQLNAYCGEPIDFVHTDNVSTAIFKAWALHISQLKIYDKPKELGEFRKSCKCFLDGECNYKGQCKDKIADYNPNGKVNCYICNKTDDMLTRPPQSWCYVEELIE